MGPGAARQQMGSQQRPASMSELAGSFDFRFGQEATLQSHLSALPSNVDSPFLGQVEVRCVVGLGEVLQRLYRVIGSV